MNIKSAYQKLPYKKEIFSFLKNVISLPPSVYKHLYFNGKFKVKIDSHSSFWLMHHGYVAENEVFWKGIYNGWEKQSMRLWVELSKSANVILDIGANSGIYALTSKAINNKATIHAFEPIAFVYDKLIQNVQVNDFDIICKQIAISNYNGTCTFYTEQDANFVYSVTVNTNTLENTRASKQISADTIRIDDYVKQQNISKVDLIKLDIETHEPQAIEGMIQTLNAHKPTLLVEVLSDEIGKEIEKKIKHLDYLYFNIDDKGGSITKTTHIQKSDHWNYLLCQKSVAQKLKLI